MGARSAAKTQALEQSGVLALAQVTGIHETGTRINEQPLVKIDLQISGPGIAPFASQDRVIASLTRLPMITSRKLVALVDPTTSQYQIDWERSGFVSGLMPATFTIAEDNKTYDLTGQVVPLMEILQILKANNIGLNNMIDLRSNPAARQQVQAVVRRAAAAQAPAAPAQAAARGVGGVLSRAACGTVDGATLTGVGDPACDRCDLRRRIRGQAPTDTVGSVADRAVMTSAETSSDKTDQKVSLPTLTAMVVGSMIGSGVFLLPRRFGTETGVLGAIIAWTIAGSGMLMLAFVFQRLATRKPDLDAGIFAYAKAGFGDYVGFNSAIGYWASACAGNTSYWVLITATMSAVVPAFGAGDTVAAVVVSAIGVWLFASPVSCAESRMRRSSTTSSRSPRCCRS